MAGSAEKLFLPCVFTLLKLTIKIFRDKIIEINLCIQTLDLFFNPDVLFYNELNIEFNT